MRRRTPAERVQARLDRAQLQADRCDMVLQQHLHEETDRAAFWRRLAAEPPAVVEIADPWTGRS